MTLQKREAGLTTKKPTGTPPQVGQHTTDVIYQEVRLYIEGVQVPFVSISINQSIGRLPTAEIEVPPQSGLMDICRYYEPKVHIFYQDLNLGGFRLLFWGNITRAGFQRSRSAGSSSIHFTAEHKNSLLRQVTLDYIGYINQQDTSQSDAGSALKVNNLSSVHSIVQALEGLSGVQEADKDYIGYGNPSIASADVTKAPKSLEKMQQRLLGMTGVSVNFWNQLKLEVFKNERFNTVMAGILIPLIEEGIAFFKRMSGHTFLEVQIEEDRQQHCQQTGETAQVLIPPMFATFLKSAVHSKMASEAAFSQLQFSGEMTDFLELLENFYFSVGYEVITLASPSEVPVDPSNFLPDGKDRQDGTELVAVETIVKPQLPFYYSPACNVIYPRMFHTVQVNQEERELPTRVMATHDSMPAVSGGMGVNYRGPHSIREGLAVSKSIPAEGPPGPVPNLIVTMEGVSVAPGKYEQGRGFKNMKVSLPWWLQLLARDENSKSGNVQRAQPPQEGTKKYSDMTILAASWRARNGYDIEEGDSEDVRTRNFEKDKLNPFSPDSGLQVHQSILLGSVDYEFTKKMVSGRTGSVECLFNPYIIPGYPMDVLDDSPNHPSFHALCSSVTHTITTRSISTTVGMLAVQTYAELSNYYVPPAPVYLQTALGIVSAEGSAGPEYGQTENMTVKNAGTLINNETGASNADAFYSGTLGVRAADPTKLIYWTTGQPLPQQRFGGGVTAGTLDPVPTSNGGDANDYNTSVGNLRLAARPIETKDSIEDKYGYKFIDITETNYGGTLIGDASPKLAQNTYLEPGASPFLTYMEPTDFLVDARSTAPALSPEAAANVPEDASRRHSVE